jgi:hypothetical protein
MHCQQILESFFSLKSIQLKPEKNQMGLIGCLKSVMKRTGRHGRLAVNLSHQDIRAWTYQKFVAGFTE